MSSIADVKTALRTLRADANLYVEKTEAAQAEVKADPSLKNIKRAASALKDAFYVDGAEVIGVAETLGLRYGVSPYEFKVNDWVTRGSRLSSPNGYAGLVDQGFKSIVDLTLEGTGDAVYGRAAGLRTLNVKILDNAAPTSAQLVEFLDYVTTPANQPAYVHCEQGKGRTGVAVAAYRMAVEGQSIEAALEEAKRFGTKLPNQLEAIKAFGAELAAGAVPGYPKVKAD